MTRLPKGTAKPLNVTKEAQHRVVAGLSWDPAEEPGLIGKVQALAKRQGSHHDLDLSCYIFDKDGALLETVSANPEFAIDAHGKIYHSGDNKEGIGDGDDEEISIEFKSLPAHYHSFLIAAAITSGQTFGEINNPEIRLADAYTDHNFLHLPLDGKENATANAAVFCVLSRDGDKWQLKNISAFLDIKQGEDISAALKEFIA